MLGSSFSTYERRLLDMKITLKRTDHKYIVNINGFSRVLDTLKEAFTIIANTRYVDTKLEILYDMHILPKGKRKREVVRQWLLSYPTEISIDNAVHDIIVGNHTLTDALKRKGFL